MIASLEGEVKLLAVALASKILGEKLDEAEEAGIIKEALASLKKEIK